MEQPAQPGDVLAGKYVVDRVLGKGGMGMVVAATHRELGNKVALKFMLPAAREVPGASERFLREARACVQLRSEHVARVLDVGRMDDDQPYIVMEYLEGKTLADVLHERGALPIQEAVLYVLQACVGVAEAHGKSIVHRDIKPENLFVTTRPDGSPLVKVLDFGISKVLSDEMSSATQTGTTMGSPAYMAPEQMRSAKHVDQRADIWSLGAILFHSLSGMLPFEGDTIPTLFAAVLTQPHRAVRSVVLNIPEGLAVAVDQCLAKDVDARMPNIRALADAVLPFADRRGARLAQSIRDMMGPESNVAVGMAQTVAPTALNATGAAPPQTTLSGSAGQVGTASTTAGKTSTRRFGVAAVILTMAIGVAVVLAVALPGDDGAVRDGSDGVEHRTRRPAGSPPTGFDARADAPGHRAVVLDAAPPTMDAAEVDARKRKSKPRRPKRRTKPRGKKKTDDGAFDTMQ